MTIPNMMNCPHQGDGWCLDCVREEWERTEAVQAEMRAELDAARAEMRGAAAPLPSGTGRPAVAESLTEAIRMARGGDPPTERIAFGGPETEAHPEKTLEEMIKDYHDRQP